MDMNKTMYDLFDEFIVQSLMDQVNGILDTESDIYETSVNKVHTLSMLLKTLDYYTDRSIFDELTKDLKVKIKPRYK